MRGRIGIEMALFGVFMILIVLFVAWYGYLILQIQTTGADESAVPAGSVGTGAAVPGVGTAAAPPAATSPPGASAGGSSGGR